jgi:hypothetical protein
MSIKLVKRFIGPLALLGVCVSIFLLCAASTKYECCHAILVEVHGAGLYRGAQGRRFRAAEAKRSNDSDLIPFEDNKKWGFINPKGRLG